MIEIKFKQPRITMIQMFMVMVQVLVFWATGCTRDETVSCSGDDPSIQRPENWNYNSHCSGVMPNYEKMFDQTVVHPFDIFIESGQYDKAIDDLEDLIFNSGVITDLDGIRNPVTVPVTVEYDGYRWEKVGMRFKGHSSLFAVYQSGRYKMSFVLDFDAFEESNPNLFNQRIFGFNELIFSNGFNDQSFIRDKLSAEIFRRAGFRVVTSAFAPVYLHIIDDDGEEDIKYTGMFTMMENMSQTVKSELLNTDIEEGNLYKPWGDAARWRDPYEAGDDDGTFEWWHKDIESHFSKVTNKSNSDWSDVEKIIWQLHETVDNSAQWRSELEELFDVESFIRYLAVSKTIMNWDSYSCMHHNYYLYADPLNESRITWVPWDLGETMLERQDASCTDLQSANFDDILKEGSNSEIDTNWPLITKLLSMNSYKKMYNAELADISENAFNETDVNKLIKQYHDIIAPYIVGPVEKEAWPYTTCDPVDCSEFLESADNSANSLQKFIEKRHEVVKNELQ